MPNQPDPNQNQDANPVAGVAPPVINPAMDLPPLPMDTSSGGPASAPPTSQKGSTPTSPPSSGEAPGTPPAPPSSSSVISSKPKKKFGGGKIIATILGLLLLVGGIGAGYILTQQPQLLQSQARYCVDSGCALTTDKNGKNATLDKSKIQKDKSGKEETVDGKSISEVYNEIKNSEKSFTTSTDNSSCGRDVVTGAPVCCSASTKSSCGSGGSQVVCEKQGRKECKSSSGAHCTIDADSADCKGVNAQTNEVVNPSPSPSTTASCLNVKAYDASWNELNTTDLAGLSTGSVVNFCVAGSATTGSFDKAQFKIGATVDAETTTKGQGAAAANYCQSYTIQSTDTTVSVKARIHHATLNQWYGETF